MSWLLDVIDFFWIRDKPVGPMVPIASAIIGVSFAIAVIWSGRRGRTIAGLKELGSFVATILIAAMIWFWAGVSSIFFVARFEQRFSRSDQTPVGRDARTEEKRDAPFDLARTVESKVAPVDLSRTGVFGDSFGAVTSLFSALGFAGLLYTVRLQLIEHRRDREKDEREKKEAEERLAEERRREEQARKEAAEAKELQTDLAVMAALINANAALLSSQQLTYEEAHQIIPNLKDEDQRRRARESIDVMFEAIQSYRHNLEDLDSYAENRWGWKARLARDADRRAAEPVRQSPPSPPPPAPGDPPPAWR